MNTSSFEKNSVVVRITGGLGNQLFQYAMGKSLALRHSCNLYLDCSVYATYKLHGYSLDRFKINAHKLPLKTGLAYGRMLPGNPVHKRIASRIERAFFKKDLFPVVVEQGMGFNERVLSLSPPLYLAGYWQSEKYFSQIRDVLLNEIVPREEMRGRDLQVAEQMGLVDSVSLHIRRGDYASNALTQKIHGLCSIDYYMDAMKVILPRCASPTVFVFSDDHEWVRNHLCLPVRVVYVDHNDASSNFQDLRLMSLCRHNIIANSSFSWWGAWLNRHADKIVCCPRRWFQDESRDSKDIPSPTWIQV